MPVQPRRLLAAAVLAALPLGVLPAQAAPVAPAAVPLSACENPDNGDPTVTSVAISQGSVDTTSRFARVELTVTATDSGGPGAPSGVAGVTAALVGPDGTAVPEDALPMAETSPGTWRAGVVVPRGVRPGDYRPSLLVTDAAGNTVGYGPGVRPVPGDPTLAVASVADRAAPRLVSLRLGATRVGTRRRVARVPVTARVVDARAGVTRVLVGSGSGRRGTFVLLKATSGSSLDGRWRGTMVVPRFLGSTTWRVTRVAVVDRVVNVRTYGPRKLALLDRTRRVDRAVQVRSRSDRQRPTAQPATFSASTIDVTGDDQQVVVRVRAADDRAGVAGVRLRLLDPGHSDGLVDTELRRVSGSRKDGVWEGAVTLSRCESVAGTWTAQLEVTDRADRVRQYLTGQPTLQVVAPDNLAPHVVRTSDASSRPVLDVDEDVTGITSESAVARAQHDDTTVAGTWTCTDAAGAPASCADGKVRRATFSPHPSFASVGPLSVVLNPEHSLGVTDLAGNVVGRRYLV